MRESDRSMTEAETVTLTDIFSTTKESDSSSSTREINSVVSVPSSVKRLRFHSRKAIATQNVTDALDKTNVSDKNAAHIGAGAAKSLRYNPADIVINLESIRQASHCHRQEIARKIQASFSSGTALTVHWYGCT